MVYKGLRSFRPFSAPFRVVLNTLLPPLCSLCDQAANHRTQLCHHCLTLINADHQRRRSSCLLCGVELDHQVATTTCSEAIEDTPLPPHAKKQTANFVSLNDGALHCATCIRYPPAFDRCIAASRYSPLSAKLVNTLKQGGKLACSVPMAELIIDAVRSRYSNQPERHIDLMVPVPLHINRLKIRGFNQAAEIAKPVARQLGIPLALTACARQTDTPSQQRLNFSARKLNLQQAFGTTTRVNGRRIAIIDDVVTTCATSNAVAKSLLDAGAVSCDIWCFARTPLNG